MGRSSDLDMVLVEDMVSRRHARIACTEQSIVIEDLGSTNGTFVNGEKIKKTTLKEGDRVLIGTSILKVVSTDPGAPPARKRMDEPSLRSGQTRSMSGSIDEIPLPGSVAALRHVEEERRPRGPLRRRRRQDLLAQGHRDLCDHQRSDRRPAAEERLPDPHLGRRDVRPRGGRGAGHDRRDQRDGAGAPHGGAPADRRAEQHPPPAPGPVGALWSSPSRSSRSSAISRPSISTSSRSSTTTGTSRWSSTRAPRRIWRPRSPC